MSVPNKLLKTYQYTNLVVSKECRENVNTDLIKKNNLGLESSPS